jgi:ABC-type nitrate/sulfonate/bicarbonate transport system substrate-binding protein
VDRLKLIIAFLILVFPELGWAQTAKEKIRVALGSVSVNSSVIPIGKEAGIFAKYGMEIEAIHMGGGVNSLAAVTSGSVQFLSAGSTPNVSARLGGADIVMLAVQSNRLDTPLLLLPISTRWKTKAKLSLARGQARDRRQRPAWRCKMGTGA